MSQFGVSSSEGRFWKMLLGLWDKWIVRKSQGLIYVWETLVWSICRSPNRIQIWEIILRNHFFYLLNPLVRRYRSKLAKCLEKLEQISFDVNEAQLALCSRWRRENRTVPITSVHVEQLSSALLIILESNKRIDPWQLWQGWDYMLLVSPRHNNHLHVLFGSLRYQRVYRLCFLWGLYCIGQKGPEIAGEKVRNTSSYVMRVIGATVSDRCRVTLPSCTWLIR